MIYNITFVILLIFQRIHLRLSDYWVKKQGRSEGLKTALNQLPYFFRF